MNEWFSPEELAEMRLPDLPSTRQKVNALVDRRTWRRAEGEYPANPLGWWRKREGRGGGFEYHMRVLPMRAQRALAMRMARAKEKPPVQSGAAWEGYDRAPDRKKDKAKLKFEALDAVDTLCRAGMQRDLAMMQVANRSDIALRTLYGWAAIVAGRPKGDWLPLLVPKQRGRETTTADCTQEAFETLKADFLRLEQPSFQSCVRRLEMAAGSQGWSLPSARTLERRLYAEVPPEVIILAREGVEALKRKFPAQRRDRSCFHALEAVNADGHRFDVFVKTPDGRVVRPLAVVFQDLYSGKILSWRLDESEHRGLVMLAFGDLVETFGIPSHVWLDNGRAFASKWVTGGIPNRFRFKVRQDDIPGIMKSLNVEVHWTQPYSGQSKPIERAFRDLCDTIAKHPRFEGAYTGNSVDAKPENYGNSAVAWDVFEATVAEQIAEHNARKGRRSHVCQGKLSFDAAFKASYEAPDTVITKSVAAQRRLWMLAAESVMVRSADAMIHFMGNRYWAPFSPGLAGSKVAARFDPDALHDGLHIYALDGSYIGHMPCVADTGFADQAAAREHMQARKAWLKGAAMQLAAEKRMGCGIYDAPVPPLLTEPAEAKVIRPTFGNLALKPDLNAAAAADQEAFLDAFTAAATNLLPFRRPPDHD